MKITKPIIGKQKLSTNAMENATYRKKTTTISVHLKNLLKADLIICMDRFDVGYQKEMGPGFRYFLSCGKENVITFSLPFKRFSEMVCNMDESFLITDTWDHMKNRIKAKGNNEC